MTTIAERVAAGAAFLDEHDPDWWRPDAERAIDLSTLRLSSPRSCVLGQRCPAEALEAFIIARYSRPLEDVWYAEDYQFWGQAHSLSGIPVISPDDLVAWSGTLGFNSPTGDGDEYDGLTAEWVRVIEQRRAAS